MSKEEQSKMDQLTTELAEYVCDNLCKYPGMKLEDEYMEDICSKCKLGQYLCEIRHTYNHLNDFEKSQSCKLLQTVSELRKQLPAFQIGDTAYIVDVYKRAMYKSVVHKINSEYTTTDTHHEYDSELLSFCDDDIGVIVFRSDIEAAKALARIILV